MPEHLTSKQTAGAGLQKEEVCPAVSYVSKNTHNYNTQRLTVAYGYQGDLKGFSLVVCFVSMWTENDLTGDLCRLINTCSNKT